MDSFASHNVIDGSIISPSDSHSHDSPPDPAGHVVKRLLEEENARHNEPEQRIKEIVIENEVEPSSKFKFTAAVVSVACIASVQFGYNVGITNATLPYIAWEFLWCTEDAVESANLACYQSKVYDAVLTSMLFVGAVVGSLASIPLLAKGRRFSILVSLLLVFIGSITAGICKSTSELIWSRCLTGLGTGVCAVCVPVYISEMSPAASRGFYGVFHQIAIVSGILLAILLGLPPIFYSSLPVDIDERARSPEYFSRLWWRFLYILPSILSLISGISLCLIHRGDTPHWHIEHRERMQAVEILTKVVPHDKVAGEIERLECELARGHGYSVSKELFKKGKARNGLIVALLLSLSQQLTGINAFATGCTEILRNSGFNSKQAALFTSLIFLLNVLITIPAASLIEKIGRKSLLLVGMVGQLVALGQGTIFLWVASEKVARYSALSAAIAFILFFAISLGPVVWVYIFEIFPANIKRPAVGFAVAANWVGSAIITATARLLNIKIQFTLFTGLGLLTALWILFFLKETKGRPLGDSPY